MVTSARVTSPLFLPAEFLEPPAPAPSTGMQVAEAMRRLDTHEQREQICGALAQLGQALDPRQHDVRNLPRHVATGAATYLQYVVDLLTDRT